MRRLSHRNDQARLNRSKRYRVGFTLVELLVVIAIIGVLVGLTVPAVFAVRKTFNNASVKFEVQGLDAAVAAYRTKYGDYPPDGSSWPIMESHLRKAFPNILQSELNLLNPNPPFSSANSYIRNDYDNRVRRVMDPAEALVFFLGGFSSDSQKPFTGKGGPFVLKKNTTLYRYNGSRENAFYEFKSERLTVQEETDNEGNKWYLSSDDGDLIPVYSSYNTTTPYVYFDSRTYQSKPGGVWFCNYHGSANDPILGVARPLLLPNPPSGPSSSANPSSWYENPKTFQIMSPGIDGLYGWDLQPANGAPILFSSTGQGFSFASDVWSVNSNFNRFRLPVHAPKLPMQDNVTNCIVPPTFADAGK
jgi:prepilin-type N-terminal cleavage/methylation domain-containing protein